MSEGNDARRYAWKRFERKDPAQRKPKPEPKIKRAPANKYTPARVESLLHAIALGETYSGAAAAAGIARHTLVEWRVAHPELNEKIAEVESNLRLKHLRRIEAASRKGTWQASLALLERRFPEEFGRHRVEVTGANGGPVEIVAKTYRDYPFLVDDKARDAAAVLIEALAISQRDEDIAQDELAPALPA